MLVYYAMSWPRNAGSERMSSVCLLVLVKIHLQVMEISDLLPGLCLCSDIGPRKEASVTASTSFQRMV